MALGPTMLTLLLTWLLMSPTRAGRPSVLVTLPLRRPGLLLGCRWSRPSRADYISIRPRWPGRAAEYELSLASSDRVVFYLPHRLEVVLSCGGDEREPTKYSVVAGPRLRRLANRGSDFSRVRCEQYLGDGGSVGGVEGIYTVRWWIDTGLVGSVQRVREGLARVVANRTVGSRPALDPLTGDLLVPRRSRDRCFSCQILGPRVATHVGRRCFSAAVGGGDAQLPSPWQDAGNPSCRCADDALRVAISIGVAAAALGSVLVVLAVYRPLPEDRVAATADDSRSVSPGPRRTVDPDDSSRPGCSPSSTRRLQLRARPRRPPSEAASTESSQITA
ncbi:m165 [Muromegalovirus G4]|uniref:M165 n=1 Tax=Muromegalovirus G4 TaxID=524650 RepID=B3UXB2_MUHV1|nr:m165 [Muromegalovirus G4]QNL29311.1 m165 [Muromegalovirus G4]